MNKDLHFSSKDQTWETPKELFDKLDSVFHFDIDLCASEDTNKCLLYYNENINALSINWCSLTYWMNPPYGRHQIPWISKACNDSLMYGSTILCLIPARPDTKIWQDIIFPYARCICFIKGRLKFGNSKDAAPFPSALVLFSSSITQEQIDMFISLGHTIVK